MNDALTQSVTRHWYTGVSPECDGANYSFAYVQLINPLSKHSSFGRCASPYCINCHICHVNDDRTSHTHLHMSKWSIRWASIHPLNDALHHIASILTFALGMVSGVTRHWYTRVSPECHQTITWGQVPICICPIDQSVEQAFILWTMRFTILHQLSHLPCEWWPIHQSDRINQHKCAEMAMIRPCLLHGYLVNLIFSIASWPLPPFVCEDKWFYLVLCSFLFFIGHHFTSCRWSPSHYLTISSGKILVPSFVS